MSKRILVCEFHEESCTFNPEIAGISHFERAICAEGQKVYEIHKTIPSLYHGIIDAIEEGGGEVVPGMALYSGSAGVVADDVYNLLKEKTEYYIKNSGELDGVFLSLHGATVTESVMDTCGDYIEFIRKLAGPDKVITAGCDLHANVTDKMLENADAICCYQTYPHVDFYETGYRAGKMGMRILDKKPTYMAATTLPVLVPASGFSSLRSPFKEVIDYANGLIADGTLLDYTASYVQPWLDIDPLGSTCIAIAEDPETACKYADILAEKLFAIKDECWPDLMTVDEIIDLAEKPETKKPVILADSADSPNGGAVGDSIVEALRLYERGSSLKAGMFVKDPETVAKAFEVGVGGTAYFEIGGKITPGMPGPLKAEGKVRMLSDGEFQQEGPAGKGFQCHVGRACVISVGNTDIMVCEKPMSSGDPQILRHFGIEPKLYDLIVVKANTSFLVPYGPIAGTVCFADTPGAGAPNLKRFDWKNLHKNFYPFDLDPDYKPEKATVR